MPWPQKWACPVNDANANWLILINNEEQKVSGLQFETSAVSLS